jgi:hypothetical protein
MAFSLGWSGKNYKNGHLKRFLNQTLISDFVIRNQMVTLFSSRWRAASFKDKTLYLPALEGTMRYTAAPRLTMRFLVTAVLADNFLIPKRSEWL